MKLIIHMYAPDMYCIDTQTGYYSYDSHTDVYIAELLGLTYEEYANILQTHNACIPHNDGEYVFSTMREAKGAIRDLQPYLIMANLVGD